ncbi:hypothetical protein G7Y89_g2980 [Cudoniella acicularis]|uniref:RRM domain-containing protein n=1 Tax=Cudoniella acicularis TaxID=354080 RepID=A0A8H4W5L9_9HELO|nr:hypothetical protein G7Y89_g2980 [Cudoniella acicularis]
MSRPATIFKTGGDSAEAAHASAIDIENNEGVPITDFTDLSINDENSVEIKSEASGSYSIDVTKAKTAKGFSPGIDRYRPPFVLKGTQALSDDPFQSPHHRGSQNQGTDQRTPTGPNAKRGHMSENWRSGSSSGSDLDFSPSRDKAERSAKRAEKKSPGTNSLFGRDRGSDNSTGFHAIKDEDSQSIFPPSCCVFVANLLQSESEEALQAAVTQVFREFGPVYVKIRRDAKQMPFAFCQYTIPENAERAIREGRGRLIKVDHAAAKRPRPIYGPVVTPEEVRKLLETFGRISSCYTASNVERTALNLNEGVIVEFELYDEGQAAFAAFRNHDLFKLHAVAGMASPSRPGKSPGNSADRAYLDRYEVDRCSVFVGNLPVGTTEAQVSDLFEQCGTIEQIVLRETASKFDAQDKFVFAFVEFTSPIAVTRAIPFRHGTTFGGKTLRVSQKDTDAVRRRSRGQDDSSSSTFQSPAPRRSNSSVSPMTQMSPSAYGSFGSASTYPTQFSPFYPGTLFTDGQGQYYTAPAYSTPYSPYYSYPSSPAYPTHSAQPSPSSGSPGAQQAFYYYGYPPAPHYGMYTPTTQQQQQASPPPTNYPPAYSPLVGNTTQDDRSATPTPVGHTESAESTLEAQ